MITTTAEKTSDAKELGASRVVVSTDKDQMKDAAGSLDFI
ncbi:MAG: NAD(P)-dependent alcohol dehydrogenase, partial [Proteobacteria bacterium]